MEELLGDEEDPKEPEQLPEAEEKRTSEDD